MLAPLLLALALTGSTGVDPARAELDLLASRIEWLKSRRLVGENVERELDRLLVRAQELAADLERRARPAAAPRPSAPSADELLERADALHDEADRLLAALAALEVRMNDARRADGPPPGSGYERSAVARGAPSPTDAARLEALHEERARLVARLGAVRAEAGALEAEAKTAEGER